MIIRRDLPVANNHPEGLASWKGSSGWMGFFSIYLLILKQISYFPPTNIIFSFKTFLLLPQILGSMFNLVDLSRTMFSCFWSKAAGPLTSTTYIDLSALDVANKHGSSPSITLKLLRHWLWLLSYVYFSLVCNRRTKIKRCRNGVWVSNKSKNMTIKNVFTKILKCWHLFFKLLVSYGSCSWRAPDCW